MPAAESRVAAAIADRATARQGLTEARQALRAAHASMVAANGTASSFGRLTKTAPVVLLPVRLETRWFALTRRGTSSASASSPTPSTSTGSSR